MKMKLSPTQLVFIGMLLGLFGGWFFPQLAVHLEPLSQIFIRLIKTIIVPIIFATLVVGIAGHGDIKSLGRMGLKSLIYFEIVTTLALGIGLLIANLMQPGAGIALTVPPRDLNLPPVKQHTLTEMIINIFPENVLDAAARADVLEIVVFTVIFAIALGLVRPEKRRPIIDLCDSLAETMFKYTAIIMKFAPVGVGAAIAVIIGSKGPAVLLKLGLLIVSLYLGLFIFLLLVLFPVILIARIPLRTFLSAVREPAVIAFSTSSSEAALPSAMQNMEAMGVPRGIVAFVMPTGYSFNLAGTTLYMSLAAIFIAQAAGMELTLNQQFLMGFTMIFTSKGLAGVPRASLVVLAGTLAAFNLPVQALAVILSVDSIMDMGRSAVNTVGNCLATAVIARWEGEYPPRGEDMGPASR